MFYSIVEKIKRKSDRKPLAKGYAIQPSTIDHSSFCKGNNIIYKSSFINQNSHGFKPTSSQTGTKEVRPCCFPRQPMAEAGGRNGDQSFLKRNFREGGWCDNVRSRNGNRHAGRNRVEGLPYPTTAPPC